MDNQRLLIWGLFGFLAWITYQTWVQDYAPKPVAQVTQTVDQPGLTAPNDGADDSLPELRAPTDGGATWFDDAKWWRRRQFAGAPRAHQRRHRCPCPD